MPSATHSHELEELSLTSWNNIDMLVNSSQER